MRKITKISLAASLTAAFIAASYYGTLFCVEKFVDLNKYKNKVFTEIESQTGFKVSSEDISFKKSLSPKLKIHMFHTLVLYPDESVFLKLKEIDLKIKIFPLIFGKIVIEDAKLERPIINITLYKDFSTSLEKYINNDKVVKTGYFTFDSFIYDTVCNRYKLKINDESLGKTFILEGDELLLKDVKLNDKAHIILKGSLIESNNKYLNYDLDLVTPVKVKKNHFTFSPFRPIYESDIKGNVFGHLKINDDNIINGSLKLNDISIKADNITLENNNINLDFKGDKVDIDSVVHTSQKDSAKLKGNVSFGKKKFVKLNANAKNININNLYKIFSVISQSLNIKTNLTDIKVKGLLNADFNIMSDFKTLKSQGEMKIINARLEHKLLPYSIDDINADISLNNNNINIKQAFANVNKTPVVIKGNVNEDVSFNINAVSENLNLVNIINLFNLKDKINADILSGKLSFDSDIKGVLNKSYILDSEIKLSDIKLKDKKYNLPINAKSIKINIKGDESKYNADILCTDLSLILKNKKILSNQLKILLDNKKIIIPENEIISPLKFKISGEINNYKDIPIGNITLIGSNEARKISELLNDYINLPNKALGVIKTSAKISFDKDKLNLKTKINADKDNYISYLVISELLNKPSVLSIDADIIKNNLNIKEILLKDETKSKDGSSNEIIKITGEINNQEKPVCKDLTILIPQSITFASGFFGGEETSLKGNIVLNNQIERPEITGNLKIYKYNLRKYLTAIKNADVSFAKDNIRVIAPDIQINDSAFNVVMDIKPDLSPKSVIISNMQLNSLNLDVNSFFKLIEQGRNPFIESYITVKNGHALINNFKILDLEAKDAVCDFSIEKNTLKINNIDAKAYNGKVQGSASYDISHGSLSLKTEAKGINIRDSLYDLCKIADNLEGIADVKTDISMITGSSYNNVIKSIKGKAEYKAYNGKMGTLGKFEHYLYAKNLLYHGLLNTTLNRLINSIVRDDTARYKTSEGVLLFQNGYLITDDLKTQGKNMSVFMKGRHNLLTNEANIIIYGRISDEISNKLGSFGDVSISELVSGQKTDKSVTVMKLSNDITDKIPLLYNQSNQKTNLFSVNIYGNINSLNAINSFKWIIPNNEDFGTDIQEKEENNLQDDSKNLPDFNDMIQNL